MIPIEQEEEGSDPRAKVIDEIMQWAQMEEADGMRSRYGKPPRPPPPGEEEPFGAAEGPPAQEEIPGVEPAEDGEGMPPSGGLEAVAINGDAQQELDPEMLKALLASMGG